jgi:SAM-dependent methyltransferase
VTGETEGEWRSTNLALWEEMAAIHPETELYDLDGLVAGRDDIRPWEDAELGPVNGLDLIHLQCHMGTDTIGWARRGARVVGLDFSATALATARKLSERCGVDIEWIESDVYAAAAAVGGRTFDVVYTGIGALGWLPDLGNWAQVVRQLLKPGGVLYLVEVHPMWVAMVEDGRTICEHAIDAPFQLWESEGEGSYAAPDRPLEHGDSYERLQSISDVLTAVLDGGLTIELFHEFDVTPAPTPWLERRDDRLYRFPDGAFRFPLTYSLRASLGAADV